MIFIINKILWFALILFTLFQSTISDNAYCNSDADYCFNITLPDKNLPDDQKWVEFRLESQPTAGWLGIGIGQGMSGYLIVTWLNNDGTVTLSQRSGGMPDEPKATNYQSDLQLVPNKTSGLINNRLVVYFRRLQTVRDSTINETQNFAWAYSTNRPSGKDPTSTITKHIYKDNIVLDLANTGLENSSGSSNTYNKLIISHAIIMFLAWMVFLPGAVFVARFARTLSFWVQLHMSIQIFIVVPLVIAGSVIVYVAVGGYQTSDPHKILGLILFICLFVQIFIGLFHHKTYDAYREHTPWWTHLHRWLGRAIVTLAIFQVPLGLSLYGAQMSIFYIYYVYVSIVIIIFSILSVRLCYNNVRKDSRDDFRRMNNSDD
ncbi:CBD9-like protein [Gigaspora margarita]|uniref:CBD9-like protein n=1 Tax=Gigaspora margarita TaxID=4874 RepID=A0A8H3X7W2_GIGMA|nr:CBD9-like protein [Gigaspora margarita]